MFMYLKGRERDKYVESGNEKYVRKGQTHLDERRSSMESGKAEFISIDELKIGEKAIKEVMDECKNTMDRFVTCLTDRELL